MTTADEQDIKNLIDGARNMKGLYDQVNKRGSAESEAIRAYAIAAVRDYDETREKLVKLINAAHDLYPSPSVIGTIDRTKHFDCATIPLKEEYDYTTGTFYILCGEWKNALGVIVENIKGRKVAGYCGEPKDKNIDTSDWIATDVSLCDTKQYGCENDLIEATFNKRLPYTIENLKKYNWNTDGWVWIKAAALRTRNRTLGMVDAFKKALAYHAEKNKNLMNNIASASNGTYVKVNF